MQERIRLEMQDGRRFEGTAYEIVSEMRALSFDEGPTFGEFVDDMIGRAATFHDVTLKADGDTDEARATAFVQSMLDTGIARYAKPDDAPTKGAPAKAPAKAPK